MHSAEMKLRVKEWLDRIEAENALGGARRRYELLRYLLTEELEGRGHMLKAFAVGVDVLNRGPDFDPSTDSIVRVEVARLRTALELYYAHGTKPNEPYVQIPKGTYRPTIDETSKRAALSKPVRQKNARVAILFIAALTAALAGLLIFKQSIDRNFGISWPAAPNAIPTLEVLPVPEVGNVEPDRFGLAFRNRLIADLAHQPTLRVRDGTAVADDLRTTPIAPAEYSLSVLPFLVGGEGTVVVQLATQPLGEVIWAGNVAVPDNAPEFYSELMRNVEGIAREIAGPSGTIVLDQLESAIQNSAEVPRDRSEYNCLIVSLYFDATRDAAAGEQAARCLSDAVERGTRNSTLWALYALNEFIAAGSFSDDSARTALNEIREYAAQATRLNPNDAIAQEVLGDVLSALDDRAGAIERYQRAISLAPSRVEPHFHLGWQLVLANDWEEGIRSIQHSINVVPTIPSYMVVPLALDAFRRNDFAQSLNLSRTIIDRGDPRGFALAFAAAAALGDADLARTYQSLNTAPLDDPLRAIRVTFSHPEILRQYEDVLEPFIAEAMQSP